MRSTCVQQRALACGIARTGSEYSHANNNVLRHNPGDAGLLRSAAGTLTPFEQLRIVSVRRRSFDHHDFDDPRDNGQYPFKVCASRC